MAELNIAIDGKCRGGPLWLRSSTWCSPQRVKCALQPAIAFRRCASRLSRFRDSAALDRPASCSTCAAKSFEEEA